MASKPKQLATQQDRPAKQPATTNLYRIRRHLQASHAGREADAVPAAKLGLRERNKADKLQRIFSAARRQFAADGYDGATLRSIADEAHVALGTLGFYADNKRDLILLIFNEAVPPLLARGRAQGVYRGVLVDSLVAFFRPTYAGYGAEPELYRTVLRENFFHSTSQHAREFHRVRLQTIGWLQDLISEAQAAGEVRADADIQQGARAAFFLFFAAVRWWISSPQPTVETGLSELRSMLVLLFEGLRAAALPRHPAIRPTSRARRSAN